MEWIEYRTEHCHEGCFHERITLSNGCIADVSFDDGVWYVGVDPASDRSEARRRAIESFMDIEYITAHERMELRRML